MALKGSSGTQLKMFMTPREITDQYQPLEADWSGHEQPDFDGSAFGLTARKHNTQGASNFTAQTYRSGNAYDMHNTAGEKLHLRTPSISEDQFWDSKRQEIDWGDHANADDTNLFDSVRDEGVRSPVHLGTGGETGRLGKPQIVGGHHRIAAATDERPDDYIPVLHHNDIHDARSSSKPFGGYR